MPKRTQAPSPATAIDGFLDRFEPSVATTARKAVALLRKRYGGATVWVYDNFNALVFAFGQANPLFSIAVYPRYATLFFAEGTLLADPEGLLEGSGSTYRHLKLLDGVAMLDRPAVKALLSQAVARASPPLAKRGGTVVIKSISKKQRPRRPTSR